MATLQAIEANTTTAPERRPMSYEEYLEQASESRIMEWADGEVIIYMPPAYRHQEVIGFLDKLISLFVRFFDLGVSGLAPFEVKLWPDGPSREPDIFFIHKDNQEKLTEQRFEGGPDLVIEIISPSSVTQDRVRKFAEYEQAGVREYWIIDPRAHQKQADFYVLDENGEFQAAELDENGRFHSTVLPHFWLNVHWLEQDELPNPQRILAEIMLTVPDLPDEAREAYEALHRLLSQKERKP